MHYYRLIISYKGTHYYGWQALGSGENKPTIEATVQNVLNKICKYKSCTISVASRTDAGVHAQGQVVKVSMDLDIEPQKLLLGMNSLLPADIRVLVCEPCTKEFNSNTNSTSKEYHYYFCTDVVYNPVLHESTAHVPFDNNSFDIQLLQEACKLFVGEHDFYSFAKRDTSMNSTVRTIYTCELVQEKNSRFNNNVYYLKIIGKGFLRHMVRYIAGALFSLGRKELSLNDIREALQHHKEEKISSKAKAQGLHLIKVSY